MSRLANVFSALNNSDSEDDGYTKVVHKKKDIKQPKDTIQSKNFGQLKENQTNNKIVNKFSLKNHIHRNEQKINEQKTNEQKTNEQKTNEQKIINVQTQQINDNVNINNIEREPVNFDEFGKTKLNTPWCLWFHHDPNDWTKNGYKKIVTFETINDYVRIMTHLHMVTSIKNINLYLFRDGIEPTWEHKANSNGGCWSIKSNMEVGFDLWQHICNRTVTETLLKTFGEIDVNGTVNGISVTNKSINKIIKIWVSDRKVSNTQWIDREILNKLTCKVLYQAILPEN
jgi:hypothetical protein